MIYGRNQIQTRIGIILSHASVYVPVTCNQISFISPIIFRKGNVIMMIWFHTAMHYTLLHRLPWACTKKIMPKYTSDHTCNVNYFSRNSIWWVKYSVYDGIAVNGRYKFHTFQCYIGTIYIWYVYGIFNICITWNLYPQSAEFIKLLKHSRTSQRNMSY